MTTRSASAALYSSVNNNSQTASRDSRVGYTLQSGFALGLHLVLNFKLAMHFLPFMFIKRYYYHNYLTCLLKDIEDVQNHIPFEVT